MDLTVVPNGTSVTATQRELGAAIRSAKSCIAKTMKTRVWPCRRSPMIAIGARYMWLDFFSVNREFAISAYQSLRTDLTTVSKRMRLCVR